MRTCSLPECDERHHAHGLCKVHDRRQQRHGDPTVVRMGRGQLNPNWHGDDVTYVGAHKRVHRERGRAVGHSCSDCGKQAAQWSYDGLDANERRGPSRDGFESAYSTDPSHYVPRCVSCHVLHDKRIAVA